MILLTMALLLYSIHWLWAALHDDRRMRPCEVRRQGEAIHRSPCPTPVRTGPRGTGPLATASGPEGRQDYIMSDISSMLALLLPLAFDGLSAIIASVVISNPATEAAYSSAIRTTFVGSMIPAFNIST